ncbi:hypothetical protein [Halomonas sp.]|uniref:hypothetical protein n=1 Tax=Halomonas sp. TaxID=1486246 RepID=UPI003A8FF4AD
MDAKRLPFTPLELAEAGAAHSAPSSPEYRLGLAARLDEHVSQCRYKDAPYDPGTAEHDAYQAGREHGHRVINLLDSLPS